MGDCNKEKFNNLEVGDRVTVYACRNHPNDPNYWIWKGKIVNKGYVPPQGDTPAQDLIELTDVIFRNIHAGPGEPQELRLPVNRTLSSLYWVAVKDRFQQPGGGRTRKNKGRRAHKQRRRSTRRGT